MVKKISDNEIYLLIKYIKSVLWSVGKCLSYIEEARCLKVNTKLFHGQFPAVRASNSFIFWSAAVEVAGYRTFGESNCLSKTSVPITYLHGFITGKVNQDPTYYFSVFQPAVKLKIREIK
jgi:hypothetical protein